MTVNQLYLITLIVIVFLLGYLNYQGLKPLPMVLALFVSVIEIFKSTVEMNQREWP